MKRKLLSLLLTAACIMTAVPPVPAMGAPVQEEETGEPGEEKGEAAAAQNSGKAVGADGILYEGTAYLSVDAYERLPQDTQEAYIDMCGLVAQWNADGVDMQDIVLSVDEDGKLGLDAVMPLSELYTWDVARDMGVPVSDGEAGGRERHFEPQREESGQPEGETEGEEESAGEQEEERGGSEPSEEGTDGEEKPAGEQEEERGGSGQPEGEAQGEEEPAGAQEEERGGSGQPEGEADGEEEPAGEQEEERGGSEPPEERADGEEKPAGEQEEERGGGGQSEGEAQGEEEPAEPQEEESDGSGQSEGGESGDGTAISSALPILPENTALAASHAFKEEIIVQEPFVELDTLISNENYFKNQLNSIEKELYALGKSSLVSKGANGFTYRTSASPSALGSDAFTNAVSALVNTYPNRFNWMDLGNGGMGYSCRYPVGGQYEYNLVIQKSPHYKDSLETRAKKKVEQLVDAAVTYAADRYPQRITYGMIEYFDKWVCENNYYNYVGTYNDAKSRGSDVFFYCHSCYGILLQGYGVCESYALSMTRLLDAAGIRNMYVVGDAGGGHAWNYVQMPDNRWYLLDSTWNDNEYTGGSDQSYLLVKNDGVHRPTGKRFVSGMKFKFETVASSDYDRQMVETSALDASQLALKPKQRHKLSTLNVYYEMNKKSWSSDNAEVAKIDQNGNVTAGSAPGEALIRLTMKSGRVYTCKVYVYQFTGLAFDNKKTSFTETYGDSDGIFNAADRRQIRIFVNQKNKSLTAAGLCEAGAVKAPTVSSGNPKVATAHAALQDDTILLDVSPLKTGTAKFTVKFAGKKASYTLHVKCALQEDWFALEYSAKDYTGKALKPKVAKTAKAGASAAGKAARYKVTYQDNKNAGTATVTIKGSGNYGGEPVIKTFEIRPVKLSGASAFVSCASSATYNGAGQKAATKVKAGAKTLKAGADYTVYYKPAGSKEEPVSEPPIEVGKYEVSIQGRNYAFSVRETKSFEIKPAVFDKVKVSVPSSVKLAGNSNVTQAVKNKLKVKLGKNVLKEGIDYTVSFCDKNGNKISSGRITARGSYKAVIEPTGKNITTKGSKKTSITKTFKVV